MKTIRWLLLLLFAAAPALRGMPIEGEQSPGVSKPIAADSAGRSVTRPDGFAAWTTWLPSATYTAAQVLVFTNHGYSGVSLVCIITSAPGVENITFRIQARDPSGTAVFINLATSSATTTTGTVVVTLASGVTGTSSSTAGQVVNGILPAQFQLRVTPSGSGNWVYSCSYSLSK